jgi:hypothetical protein
MQMQAARRVSPQSHHRFVPRCAPLRELLPNRTASRGSAYPKVLWLTRAPSYSSFLGKKEWQKIDVVRNAPAANAQSGIMRAR